MCSNHKSDWITNSSGIKNFIKEKRDLEIGSDVWVGGHSIILSGIKIGHGCVIGAGSVTRESLDPYSIVIGNHTRIIKKRFNKQVIKKFLHYSCWVLDDDKIN